MGDEIMNPFIPVRPFKRVTGHGNELQPSQDIDTAALYDIAKEKYDIYHINVAHRGAVDMTGFNELLGNDHVFSVPVNGVAQVIAQIVKDREAENAFAAAGDAPADDGFISW